jgi:hypothetical protein
VRAARNCCVPRSLGRAFSHAQFLLFSKFTTALFGSCPARHSLGWNTFLLDKMPQRNYEPRLFSRNTVSLTDYCYEN